MHVNWAAQSLCPTMDGVGWAATKHIEIHRGHETISTDGFRDTVCYDSFSACHSIWKCPIGSNTAKETCNSSVIQV